MGTAMHDQKAAVDSGQWLLYRYNPDADGANPLTLNSRAPKLPLKQYMNMENRFRMLELTHPERAAELFEEAQGDVADALGTLRIHGITSVRRQWQRSTLR